MISRRSLLTGMAGLLAAPAIVRASSLDFIPRSRVIDFGATGTSPEAMRELGYYNVTEVGDWLFNEHGQVWLRTTTIRRMNEHEDVRFERVEARTHFEDTLNAHAPRPAQSGWARLT